MGYIKRHTPSAFLDIMVNTCQTHKAAVLQELAFRGSATVPDIAARFYTPINVTTYVVNDLCKSGYIAHDNEYLTLSSTGLDAVRSKLDPPYADFEVVRSILSTPIEKSVISKRFSKEITLFDQVLANAPRTNLGIDQTRNTALCGITRAILFIQNYGFINPNILFVGDNDLTSIAITIMLKKIYQNSFEEKVVATVMDIDTRLLEYISKHSYISTCINQDFRDAPVSKYLDCFSSAFLDPPYTLNGLRLFLSRAVQYVKGGAKLFLSYGHGTSRNQYEIQKIIIDSNLSICEIHPSFNPYIGANSWGRVSDMMILQSDDNKHAIIPGQYHGQAIYTSDLKRSFLEEMQND